MIITKKTKFRDEVCLEKLGIRIQECRKLAGLSQSSLAINACLCRNTIIQIERGKINPTYLSLAALAKTMNLTVHDLIPAK